MRRGRVCRQVVSEPLESRQLLAAQLSGALTDPTAHEFVPGGVILEDDGPRFPLARAASPTDPGGGLNVGSFDIVLKKGPNLTANAQASAAFDQAAAFIESIFSDPVTVVVDAEVASLAPRVRGSPSGVQFFTSFDTIRNPMVTDRAADESIAASLPTAAQFTA